ncbi:hypothetical protein ACIPV2_07920 [Microbacterium sp. NPDC089987]|uniref:hypothetical protein n=1 Tax=Microbacterium sp. NPDC089987 TaxID=3364202 RepID=UPI00380F069C
MSGIAVVNVMLPALVRATSGTRMRSVTTAYTTVLSASSAIGAAAGVPVAHALGSATLSLGSWALLAVVALGVWIAAVRGRGIDDALAAPASQGRVPLPRGTWPLTGFFALQALLAFVVMGWLPTIAVDSGITPARAGVLLGIVIMVSIPAGMAAVSMAHTLRGIRIGVVGVSVSAAAGLLGLWLAPTAAPELWSVLIGAGMAAFPLTLALIARSGSGAVEATRVSGVAQGVGYAISTIGPLGAGAWYGAGGEWGPVLVALVVGAVLQALIGLALASAPKASDRKAAAPRA